MIFAMISVMVLFNSNIMNITLCFHSVLCPSCMFLLYRVLYLSFPTNPLEESKDAFIPCDLEVHLSTPDKGRLPVVKSNMKRVSSDESVNYKKQRTL